MAFNKKNKKIKINTPVVDKLETIYVHSGTPWENTIQLSVNADATYNWLIENRKQSTRKREGKTPTTRDDKENGEHGSTRILPPSYYTVRLGIAYYSVFTANGYPGIGFSSHNTPTTADTAHSKTDRKKLIKIFCRNNTTNIAAFHWKCRTTRPTCNAIIQPTYSPFTMIFVPRH